MDMLKAVVYIIMVQVATNMVAGYMLPAWGITPPYTDTPVVDPDPGGVVDAWGGGESAFYDIAAGLVTLWGFIANLVQGFPAMLQAFGAPLWLYEPLYWIYRMMWLIAITLGVIAGRTT